MFVLIPYNFVKYHTIVYAHTSYFFTINMSIKKGEQEGPGEEYCTTRT